MKTEAINMLESTLKGLKKFDTSITDEKINSILNLFNSEKSSAPDRAISRKAAAYLIGKSEKTVDYHCKIGDLRKIRGKNCSRASGISLLSLSEAFGIEMPHLLAALEQYNRAA